MEKTSFSQIEHIINKFSKKLRRISLDDKEMIREILSRTSLESSIINDESKELDKIHRKNDKHRDKWLKYNRTEVCAIKQWVKQLLVYLIIPYINKHKNPNKMIFSSIRSHKEAFDEILQKKYNESSDFILNEKQLEKLFSPTRKGSLFTRDKRTVQENYDKIAETLASYIDILISIIRDKSDMQMRFNLMKEFFGAVPKSHFKMRKEYKRIFTNGLFKDINEGIVDLPPGHVIINSSALEKYIHMHMKSRFEDVLNSLSAFIDSLKYQIIDFVTKIVKSPRVLDLIGKIHGIDDSSSSINNNNNINIIDSLMTEILENRFSLLRTTDDLNEDAIRYIFNELISIGNDGYIHIAIQKTPAIDINTIWVQFEWKKEYFSKEKWNFYNALILKPARNGAYPMLYEERNAIFMKTLNDFAQKSEEDVKDILNTAFIDETKKSTVVEKRKGKKIVRFRNSRGRNSKKKTTTPHSRIEKEPEDKIENLDDIFALSSSACVEPSIDTCVGENVAITKKITILPSHEEKKMVMVTTRVMRNNACEREIYW